MGRGQGDMPNRKSMNWYGGRQRKVCQNRKMDEEEWDDLWADARDMRLIEDRRIDMGEEAGGEVHQINLGQNSHRKCMRAWEECKK